jgi:hypothetical protein
MSGTNLDSLLFALGAVLKTISGDGLKLPDINSAKFCKEISLGLPILMTSSVDLQIR